MGYRAKLAHGKKVTKTPLPPAEEGQSEIIEFGSLNLEKQIEPEKYPEVHQQFEALKRTELAVEWPADEKHLHPLLHFAQHHFRSAKPSTDGRLYPIRGGCVDIRVSPGSLVRALRLFHALIRLCEAHEFTVRVDKDSQNEDTFVTILQEDLQIVVKELVKRTQIPRTSGFNDYEYHPTELLCLEVKNVPVSDVRLRWCDTEKSKLEDKMLQIVGGLIDAAYQRRIWHMDLEERDRKYEQQEAIRKAEAQKRSEEQGRFDKLLKDAKDWQTSQTIRSYINAVRASVKGDETKEARAELERWLEWAEQEADELDPAKSRRPSGTKQNAVDL